MFSSAADGVAVGAALDSTSCAKPASGTHNSAVTRATNLFISLANLRHSRGNSMPLQKPMHVLSEFRPDPLRRCNLVDARFAQSIYRSESPQQQILAVLTDAGAIVENALADPLLHQQLVIGIRESVRFVADALE